MTQTVEVMENQAQEFIDYAQKKGFTISQGFIDAVIAELKSVNMWRESVSLKTFKMGLAAAIDSGKILTPVQKPIDIGAAATALQNTFPPVVKKIRKESSTDYVNSQSGRLTRAERAVNDAQSAKDSLTARTLSHNAELRLELKTRLAAAETAMDEKRPFSHAANYAERARLKALIAADKKYDPVR